MKIALICPSNMLYMPYVSNYETILKENNVDYDIINWDRFNIEDKSTLVYQDSKTGHQRNFFDYYKYKKFIVKKLNEAKYDKVIVFGIQLTFFLRDILRKEYCGKYIIDIRDHNKIINYFNIEKVIQNSLFTVLSSLGFQEWLPSSHKYIVNHNTQVNSLHELKDAKASWLKKDKINIAYIGAIRDYQVNIDFIDALKNNESIVLNFHGEGDINKNIQDYLKAKKINNVYLTGRYSKQEEENLYSNNDLINVLRYNDGINNKTALPNRLYNAAINGKPMIGFIGTYLAEQIDKYKLGIIINSFEDIADQIKIYLDNFDRNEYEKKRHTFFRKVIEDNKKFKIMLFKEFK